MPSIERDRVRIHFEEVGSGPPVVLGIGALVRRDSVADELGKVEAPSLIIVGDEDVSLPLPCSREIAAALPNASLVVVREAGHLSALEQPEAVTEAMMRFLDALS